MRSATLEEFIFTICTNDCKILVTVCVLTPKKFFIRLLNQRKFRPLNPDLWKLNTLYTINQIMRIINDLKYSSKYKSHSIMRWFSSWMESISKWEYMERAYQLLIKRRRSLRAAGIASFGCRAGCRWSWTIRESLPDISLQSTPRSKHIKCP